MMRHWMGRAIMILGLVGFLLPASAAPRDDYSNVWSHFAILVWQYKTPPPGPGAERAYESLNLSGIHLDNGFPEELLEFAIENDYEYYLDHAAGKGDLFLYRREWQPFREAYKQNRSRPVRPRCLHDPEVRARLFGRLRENIPRASRGLALAYAFDDEISTTSFTNPVDLCWSDRSIEAFRDWLRERYGTVAALNTQWGTAFASFEEAEPATVDDVRGVHELPFSEWNLSRWADHREFMDDTFSALLTELREEANRLDPTRPAGFVGGQAPATYGGYDYAKLTRAVQWMEAYDIGGTNEILRSFWGTEKPHVQTYFATGEAHVDTWFLWYYLVHGNRGVIVWPEVKGKPWFDGETPQPELLPLADTFGEVQGLISERFVGAEFDDDGVGLYYSQPSVRVSWMMDIEPHGSAWVNRSSSLNDGNATSIWNRIAWMKWLEDSGIQYDVISYLDVQEGKADLSRYRVIILPRTFALSEAEADALRAFVEAGGTLIADYGTGIFDEHGRGREEGALDALFGVARDAEGRVLDGENIAEINAEKYQQPLRERVNYDGARRSGEFVLYERILRGVHDTTHRGRDGGADFLIHRTVERGQTFYLNMTPLPYLWLRREPGGAAYRALLREVLAAAEVTPRVEVFRDGEPAPTIERLFWKKDGVTYLCLVENPIRDAKIDGMGATEGIPQRDRETIEIRFAGSVRALVDERTNVPIGSGRSFTVEWSPYEAAVYRVEWEEDN